MRSRRELSIGMVIDSYLFKNNKITLFPVLPSYPKQECDYLK